jgi:acetate kinase
LIEEAQTLYPKVPHIACFDTAFHHTMPELQRRFALPQSFHDEGIMRYGFHGLSYEYIASVMPDMMPDHERVIVAHLGGGSSACAIHNGQSVASTMGFSTLDGLMMGSRCGALDAGVLLYLLQAKNMSADHLSDLLYHGAGLKGVSGISGDMQELLASDTPSASLAVDLFCSMAASQIAGLMPALGGLDALIFTGGIGEHAAPIRDKITALLRWVGEFKVHTIPTNEELVMARACLAFSNALQRKATSRWENEGGAIINMEQKTHVNSNN